MGILLGVIIWLVTLAVVVKMVVTADEPNPPMWLGALIVGAVVGGLVFVSHWTGL